MSGPGTKGSDDSGCGAQTCGRWMPTAGSRARRQRVRRGTANVLTRHLPWERGATMANIVAAQFDDMNGGDAAGRSLSEAGFAPTPVGPYFLNPPGPHSRYPIRGRQDM